MTIKCLDATMDLRGEQVHIYEWSKTHTPAQRLVVLVHGLMMHGGSFESFARYLAAAGNLVVAPDLRGFGRWHFSTDSRQDRIDHKKSLEDLSLLIQTYKDNNPGLPVYCVGESLGAHFARRVAAMHPQLLSGLILSSPCLRPRILSLPLIPYACSELVLSGIDPARKMNLSPFAERFLRDEPENLRYYLEDPMSRKSLEILELIDSLRIVGLIDLVKVPPEIPVLVLRGKNDCVCKNDSVKKFIDSLDTEKLTVHADNCGHMILQVSELKETVLAVLSEWLKSRRLGEAEAGSS